MIAPFMKTFGGLLAVSGTIGALVGLISVLDPVGSQMANDSAPFSQPASVWQSLAITLGWFVIAAFGVWLLRHASKV